MSNIETQLLKDELAEIRKLAKKWLEPHSDYSIYVTRGPRGEDWVECGDCGVLLDRTHAEMKHESDCEVARLMQLLEVP